MDLNYQTALLGLSLACGLAVADTKMPFSKLPAAVQTAAKVQTQGAQVLGASSERENGQTTYEVETKMDGKSRDLSFDANGKLLEVEQEVDIHNIPEVAQAALLKKVGTGTIRKVESVTAGDSVSYEASITTQAGKHAEIEINADGSAAGQR